MSVSHQSSHMTHHPGLTSPLCPTHHPSILSTWLEYPCLHTGSARSGGPGPNCMSMGGDSLVLSTAHKPASHCVKWLCALALSCTHGPLRRSGQAWDVCKQQGGEVASRALTQMQVVQAKQEEQGRHCHLTPVVKVAACGDMQGHSAPHTPPLLSGLLFQAGVWDAVPSLCFLQGCEDKEHS